MSELYGGGMEVKALVGLSVQIISYDGGIESLLMGAVYA
jgi:hypothetical protein